VYWCVLGCAGRTLGLCLQYTDRAIPNHLDGLLYNYSTRSGAHLGSTSGQVRTARICLGPPVRLAIAFGIVIAFGLVAAMAPKVHPASAQSVAIAAMRSDRAREHAQTFIAQAYLDSKSMAHALINELLLQLLGGVEVAMLSGHSGDHYQAVRDSLHHITYCMDLVGPGVAVVAAEALDVIWMEDCDDGCIGHVLFFRQAGLEVLFFNCMRTIQDAIGMCMIRDGDLRRVMDHEGISLNTKSRLRNAFFIQKRYLRDVGRHMTDFGTEVNADHEARWVRQGSRRGPGPHGPQVAQAEPPPTR
jgi:hypothetical protein